MNNIPKNPVCWFDIPVLDMSRAIKFYETVFQFPITIGCRNEHMEMAFFGGDTSDYGATGGLVRMDKYVPSKDGIVIQFSSLAGDLDVELSRVEAAGGKVVLPKMLIDEKIGYKGAFIDSEGNRIAIHSHK